MRNIGLALLISFLAAAVPGFARGQRSEEEGPEKIRITYWQPFTQRKKEAMEEIIRFFQQEYPHIVLTQQTLPPERYNEQVAAAVRGKSGPNVLNLHYGWLTDYLDREYLQPLEGDAFNPARLEGGFFPLLSAARHKGRYYALPTAVNVLALFWNKRLFQEAALNPEEPPRELEELVDYAQKLSWRDQNDNLIQVGMTTELRGQLHHWMREILVRQFGGLPYTDNYQRVSYNSQAGYQAFQFFIDLIRKYRVGEPNFLVNDVIAFKAGRAGMTIDGSFQLPTLDKVISLDYALAEIPARNGVRANFASFWAHGITHFTRGKELEGSIEFLKYLISDTAMELWLNRVGELPSKREVALRPENINHPKYGPFIKGLEYAHATYFVDENAQRQVWIDAYDAVMREKRSVREAVGRAARVEQQLLDEYYASR